MKKRLSHRHIKNRLRILFMLGVTSLAIISCLHTQDGSYRNPSRGIVVSMISGNAIVDIKGRIKENLYFNERTIESRHDPSKDLAIEQGIITIEQTIELFEGQEYQYAIQGSEIISFHFKVFGGKDVRIRVRDGGEERYYTLKKDNKLGLLISRGN